MKVNVPLSTAYYSRTQINKRSFPKGSLVDRGTVIRVLVTILVPWQAQEQDDIKVACRRRSAGWVPLRRDTQACHFKKELR